MRLSVITINFNNLHGLEKTYQSVVSQTWQDFEWIVIDGGSTDGSKEFIEEHQDKFSYWVSEPDKGIYNAMNKGIMMSHGEYCFFLNSGDALIDNLVLLRVFARNFDEDVVHGSVRFKFKDHEEIRNTDTLITLRTFLLGTINHSGCSFIRRDAFDRWGRYDESLKIVSDWKWFLNAVGLGTASTKYIDVLISEFDCYGISMENTQLVESERKIVLEQLVSNRILQDYDNYLKLENRSIQQIKQIRSSATYKIGRFCIMPFKMLRCVSSVIINYLSNILCVLYLMFVRKKKCINNNKSTEKIIVSLTSWKNRINNVPIVINSILQNYQVPDKIVVNLSLEEFPEKEKELPLALNKLIQSNIVEIIWTTGNLKAFKKFIPTLKKYPEDVIIAIDDDFIYPNDFIETFMNVHKDYPNNPLSGNDVQICNAQGHCGCASLVKSEYFGRFLDELLDDNIVEIGMDDIFYPFCAAMNGYYYKYVGVPFSMQLVPFNSFDGISEQDGRYNNKSQLDYILEKINKKYHIDWSDLTKPKLSF